MSGGKISERKGLGQHREEPQPAAAGCWDLTCWQQCGSVTTASYLVTVPSLWAPPGAYEPNLLPLSHSCLPPLPGAGAISASPCLQPPLAL